MLTADTYLRSGKVRDLYELPDGRLLLVASDRISAFDVVLPTAIPEKGKVLTGLSRFWFAETASIVPNHLLDTDPAIIRDALETAVEAYERADAPTVGSFDDWRGRVMIAQRATVAPVEAVVRGYLAGSAWKEYQATGAVCGIRLPAGLRESDRLPEPIFTPATKAEQGEHDENIDFDGMVEHLEATWMGPAIAGRVAEAIRAHSIALYRYASAIAARSGILIADTKFEFGLGWGWGVEDDAPPKGPPMERIDRSSRRRPIGRRSADRSWQRLEDQLLLVDEAFTPDSSRFWDAATYEPGRPQASFDKQYVRDHLETLDWDKTAPGPALPPGIVDGTRRRYVEAFERITGASFERYLAEDVIAR